jgi:hypothetical protein
MYELAAMPPWDWPPTAAREILAVLADRNALISERLLATELAGNLIVMNDDLAEELLRILQSPDESEDLRSGAAISFGAALEEANMEGYDSLDAPAVTEPLLERAKAALRDSYQDPGSPKVFRRMALEASVRAQEPWHAGAVRAAYHAGDHEWKLTAVFCMRFVQGFDSEIVEALDSDDPDIHYEAVMAARDQAVPDAWDHLRALVLAAGSGEDLVPGEDDTERDLLIGAMHAVAFIRPLEAAEALAEIIESGDEGLSDAALEALDMVHGLMENDDACDDEPTWH